VTHLPDVARDAAALATDNDTALPAERVIDGVRYRLSDRPEHQDAVATHAVLTTLYWSVGIPLETVQRAMAHSLCLSLHWWSPGQSWQLTGFARMVTDRATFAYLCDVFVHEAHQGRGLAGWMLRALDAHPDLQGPRRRLLATRDAHALYATHGWQPLSAPDRMMEIVGADIYRRTPAPHGTGC